MSYYTENFETIFGVKNNIQALKNMVLQLAIQGKLVEQDPNDEPASELVKKIEIEKNSLTKEGKIKKEKPLKPIEKDEIPFEIPYNWEWLRLGDLGVIAGGGTPKTNIKKYWESGKIPWLTPADLSNYSKKYISVGKRCITDLGLKESSAKLFPKGTVLFSSRAPIGYTVIAENEISTNQGFKSCIPYVMDMNEYIYYFLIFSSKLINKNASGTTFKEVSGAEMRNLIIPVPPLVEQKRIVLKIEFLMSKIDRIDEILQKKGDLLKSLPQAVVDAIANCKTEEEFKLQLKFAIEDFQTIFQTPESMQDLRNVILQLAIEGKLLPQNPNDEPASELVKKIKIEKNKLIKEGKIKKEKPLKPIEEDEIHFEIPENWEWVRLGETGITQTGTTPKTSKPEYFNGDIPFIKPADITSKGINYNNESLTQLGLETGRHIKRHSNMMVCIGGSTGKTYYTEMDCSCNQQINALTPIANINYKYTHIVLSSPYLFSQVWKKSSGTATPIINKSTWDSIVIPLPSLAEQQRIVQKVELIMNTISKLENKLVQKNNLVEHMANV